MSRNLAVSFSIPDLGVVLEPESMEDQREMALGFANTGGVWDEVEGI